MSTRIPAWETPIRAVRGDLSLKLTAPSPFLCLDGSASVRWTWWISFMRAMRTLALPRQRMRCQGVSRLGILVDAAAPGAQYRLGQYIETQGQDSSLSARDLLSRKYVDDKMSGRTTRGWGGVVGVGRVVTSSRPCAGEDKLGGGGAMDTLTYTIRKLTFAAYLTCMIILAIHVADRRDSLHHLRWRTKATEVGSDRNAKGGRG